MIRKGTKVEYVGAYGIAVRPIGSRGKVVEFIRRTRSVIIQWDDGLRRRHWLESVRRAA